MIYILKVLFYNFAFVFFRNSWEKIYILILMFTMFCY